jgi:hypothetical protein
MSHFHKVASGFAVMPVLSELRGQRLLWGKSPRVTFRGSPHVETEDILIRGPIGQEHKSLQQMHEELQCEVYPAGELMEKTLTTARNLAWILSDEASRELGGLQLGRVILTKLPPNKTILPHRDEGPVPQFYRRFHMVVDGGDENIFMIDGEIQIMQTGEIWDCDVREMHTVVNLMNHDRVHLVVDVERE